jgi:hypothetical protein
MKQSAANCSPFPENQETREQETLEPNEGNIRPFKAYNRTLVDERPKGGVLRKNFSQMRPFFKFQSQVGDDFVGAAWIGGRRLRPFVFYWSGRWG